MKVDVYIAAEDKQPKRRERWTGYVIRAEVDGKEAERIGTRFSGATLFNATIMTIVEVLDRFTRPAEITIHLENSWIIGNLTTDKSGKRVLDLWQERGWKTTRGAQVKNKDEWQRLYNKIRVFEHSGGVFRFERLDEDSKYRDRILFEIKRQRKEV